MSSLSPRLQIRVQQKQTLTPGLVQMVSLLQLNRLELKDMISAEIAQNPVLEEAAEGGEELTPEELQPLLEAEAERSGEPADQSILEATAGPVEVETGDAEAGEAAEFGQLSHPTVHSKVQSRRPPTAPRRPKSAPALETPEAPADPFDEIDLGDYFDNYLDPGFKSPASENIEKPSFETFLSSPVTLSDHLRSQLALVAMSEEVRDAAEEIIGNLDENGYLTATLEEIAAGGGCAPADVQEALRVVHSLDPAGVGAADVRECLLLQLESRNAKGGVAWQIVADHLKLVESRQFKELAKVLHRPLEHIQIAIDVIRHLDPQPGLRYSGPGARQVEPDVYISKDSDDYLIQLNDDEVADAAPKPPVPAHAGPHPGAEQGRPQLCPGPLRLRHSAHEEHRAAEADHSEGLPVHRAAPAGFPGRRHRSAQAHDDQGDRRGDRRPSFHRQPRRFEQIRAHSAGRFRTALFLLRSRAGAGRNGHSPAHPEAASEEDDRRGGHRAPAYRRTNHRAVAGRRNRSDPPYRRQVSRRHADSVHASATGSRPSGGLTEES